MASGAGGSSRSPDLSDVERDMLLLAIVGKSARQVALTALRIEAVKDIIIGTLTEFLASQFSVGYVNHNVADSASSLEDRETARSTVAAPRSAAVPTIERSGPPRTAVRSRKAAAGEAATAAAAAVAYARGSSADAYTLPRLQAPAEMMLPIDSPEPSDDHGGSALESHQLSATMLPLAPHKRLLTSRPACRLDRLVQQRRSYDSHAAPVALDTESLDEDRPRRDSNGWTVGSAQAMAADGGADDCSGAGRGMGTTGAPGQCRPFTPLARDAAAMHESGSSAAAAGDCGSASLEQQRVPPSRFAKSAGEIAAAEPPTGRAATAAAGKSPAGDHYSSLGTCKQQSQQQQQQHSLSSSSMASSSAETAANRRRSSEHMNDVDGDDQWDGSGVHASGPTAGGGTDPVATAAELKGASRLQHDGNAAAAASAYRQSTSGHSGDSGSGSYSSWYPTTRKRRSVLPPMPLSSYVEQSSRRAAAAAGGGLRSSTAGRSQLNYMCPECSKDFRRQSELNRHVKIVHRQEKPYRCEECGIPFATRWNLKCHYNKQHFQQPYPSHVDGRSARAAAQRSSSRRSAVGQAAQGLLEDDEDDDGGQQEGGGGGSSGASAADMGFDGIGCPENVVVVEPEPPAPEEPYHVRGGADRLFLETPNLKLEGGD